MSFVKMLTGVYGKAGEKALSKMFNESLRSERSEILRYRPDLSYLPAAQ